MAKSNKIEPQEPKVPEVQVCPSCEGGLVAQGTAYKRCEVCLGTGVK